MGNISYWIGNNFVTVCTIALLIVFMTQNRGIEKDVRVKFRILCGMLLAESLCATADELCGDYVNLLNLRFALGTIGYFVRPAMLYLIMLLMNRDEKLRVRLLLAIPLAVEGLLLFANLFGHFMFYYYVNEDGLGNHWGRTGILGYYLYMVLFIYMTMILVSGISKYKKRKSETIVVILALVFLILDYVSEVYMDVDYNLRETATSLAIITYYIYFVSRQHYDELQQVESSSEQAKVEITERLLRQTIETLSSTIDAKDKYTQGHSARVAQYSLTIAMKCKFPEEECKQIYYAGLLHDIGKIAIPEEIINKAGKLTDEEFALIKSHPTRGSEMLAKMTDMPYLTFGAKYHHERFDGKGYPQGLGGKDIPPVGRIIAVADAYDAMSSKRSYRSVLPQAVVREQILKGIGSQFDPKYAKIMLDMIDEDKEYNMCEHGIVDPEDRRKVKFSEWWSNRSDGIRITEYPLTLHFKSKTLFEGDTNDCVPSVILYDSDDGQTGESENAPGKNDFREYAVICSDSTVRKADARQIVSRSNYDDHSSHDMHRWFLSNKEGTELTVTAVRYRDVIGLTVKNGELVTESKIVLNDSYSWSYLAIGGIDCIISEPEYSYAEEMISEKEIRELGVVYEAPDEPVGDRPNLVCDGWNRDSTDGILLEDAMVEITYKTRTYQRAKRLWHSSTLCIYSPEHGKNFDVNSSRYFFLKSDGETRFTGIDGSPEISIERDDENFTNWENWLTENKRGVRGRITVSREKNQIFFTSENAGITIKGTIQFPEDNTRPVYVVLGGELCNISNIRVQTL